MKRFDAIDEFDAIEEFDAIDEFDVVDDFDAIDALVDLFYKYMPEVVYLMKNPERYPEIEKSINELKALVLEDHDDAKIKFGPDELIGTTMCVEIETCTFAIYDLERFCSILSKASTFSIDALTNGNVEIGITFEDAWIPAPPYDEKKGGLGK